MPSSLANVETVLVTACQSSIRNLRFLGLYFGAPSRFAKGEYSGPGPPAKPPELAVPTAKGRRQIAPRRPGAHPPEDRF